MWMLEKANHPQGATYIVTRRMIGDAALIPSLIIVAVSFFDKQLSHPTRLHGGLAL